ncbi:cell wall metabolism sensor histidine kinase WalK [Paenibacillus sp. S150]|uniref:sensor histidine kinase n=1 Tax=Paenibacillus sp. S150 TaxID=2749826 RepID=UPI001C573C54|nr:HAMP domain-containing sensor histidine kinase [Paenibacillus sp. S150]MBW4085137.1 HAMP domain-containing protein [Paenibacillus sp. S150]
MIARVKGLLGKLPAPRSLRKQLLVTSLLILSGLLFLIGVLQYVLMRDFTYNNRAESMETQIRSVPREIFSNSLAYGPYGENAAGTSGGETGNGETGGTGRGIPPGDSDGSGLSPDGSGAAGPEGNGEAAGSTPGTRAYGLPPMDGSTGASGSPGGSEAVPPGNMRSSVNRRPLLLDAHATLAIYSSDGGFKDFQEETLSDSPAPRLSDAEYNDLLKHTTDKATGSYRLITAADGSEHLAVFMNLGRPQDVRLLLQMSISTGPLKDVIMQQLMIFAALSLAALLAGLFLYLPALRKTLVPLSKMGEAAQSIDAGNLGIRFPVDQGQTEIDKLSGSFNGMLERLEVSFHNEREAKEQMRRFAADASHELRTPLTSIHGFLEVLLRGAADNKEQLMSALRSMHGESKRINKLVEDLLLLARMDGAPQLSIRNMLLGDVIAEMQPQLLVLAGERRVTFDISRGIRGMYDPDRLKQVILNLFHNAVQHTDNEKGIIHVGLSTRGKEAVLAVTDNGSGISAEHIPHVFERFYRSDSSRTRKYGGSGLGLSITKSIVEAHHGDIRVKSRPGEGTTFIVTLPRLLN